MNLFRLTWENVGSYSRGGTVLWWTYTVTPSGSSRPRIRPRPRPRGPRPRPMRRVWNYRRIGTYRIAKGVSIRGRRYLGTVKQRVNPVKQCALMAREKRYRYFGLRSRRYCHGARSRRPLTKYGRTSGFRGMVVYKIGRGETRSDRWNMQQSLVLNQNESHVLCLTFLFPLF